MSDRAEGLAKILRQKGHRYYLWTDDVEDAWCHCEECAKLSPSDQCLIMAEYILKGLRRYDKDAELCYLAYHAAVVPPTRPIPEGIFAEYAPIHRDMFTPVVEGENAVHAETVKDLSRYSLLKKRRSSNTGWTFPSTQNGADSPL